MPEPDLPPAQPPAPTSEPLPQWARPAAAAAVPGARWLESARRWWQSERPGEADADAAPRAPLSTRPTPDGAAAAAPGVFGMAGPAGVPAALLERLRRCVAHAVRHPGFGFALLHLELALPVAVPAQRRARGAELARQAERRLQQALRPGDALVALVAPSRGDVVTFLMVLDGVGSDSDLDAVMQRVLAELAEPLLDGAQPVTPAARLGVVFAAPGQAPRPAEVLLQQAARALAEALPGGWALAGRSPRQPEAERLQQALGSGALQIVFEPQVELNRPLIRALGARLAWRDGAQRPVGAGADDDSDPLATALLQRTLAAAAARFVPWRAADADRSGCRLALPVAAALVRRADWSDEFAALLQDHGLAAADVQLELPPTLALHDSNLPARLQVLARTGVALALDDFGTGRSSLSALGRLPLALLKIDRGFVPQAHELEHHRVLLESTVRLASQLGIATLGKGLQTRAQLTLLRELGCERGEGAAAAAMLAPAALAGLPRLGEPA